MPKSPEEVLKAQALLLDPKIDAAISQILAQEFVVGQEVEIGLERLANEVRPTPLPSPQIIITVYDNAGWKVSFISPSHVGDRSFTGFVFKEKSK